MEKRYYTIKDLGLLIRKSRSTANRWVRLYNNGVADQKKKMLTNEEVEEILLMHYSEEETKEILKRKLHTNNYRHTPNTIKRKDNEWKYKIIRKLIDQAKSEDIPMGWGYNIGGETRNGK